jgi:2-phosphinomethylmalic acid synthase
LSFRATFRACFNEWPPPVWNAPLEAVLLHLIGMGYFPDRRPDFTVLNELTELYASIGEGLPPKYPLYGRDAHRTRAGIHADGLNKFWWMYAPFDVPRLLGRPLEVSLTKDSGTAGLIFLIKQHTGRELTKDDPAVRALHAEIAAEFEAGRQTSIEWEELQPRVEACVGAATGAREAAAQPPTAVR